MQKFLSSFWELLVNQFEDGQKSLARDDNIRFPFLLILSSVVNAGDGPSETESNEFRLAAKRLFIDHGYKSDDDLNNMLYQLQRDANQIHVDMPTFAATVPREWQVRLLLDAMRIVYSNRTVAPEKQSAIETIFAWTGMSDRSLLSLYDRSAVNGQDVRDNWLRELNLARAATPEEIQSAYRHAAKEYHPDRLSDLNLPPQMLALAKAKMAAINAAYTGLKGDSVQTDQLHFRAHEGSSFTGCGGVDFQCLCWLCNRMNRIPGEADVATVRCGECHALLGATEAAS